MDSIKHYAFPVSHTSENSWNPKNNSFLWLLSSVLRINKTKLICFYLKKKIKKNSRRN